MALAVKRPGRFVDYYVEATSEDLTSPTVGDLLAAHPMQRLYEEEGALPLPPVPMYETRAPRRMRRNVVVLAVSLFANLVLLGTLVRLVAGR